MSFSCEFRLARASHIYYCGERIEGEVVISPLKARQVEGIYLQFCGLTQVTWLDVDRSGAAESAGHNDFSSQEVAQKTLFSQQQKHVCDRLELAGSQLLQPHSQHSFTFSFSVPPDVPATSRCPLGECEYMLRLVLQRASKVNKQFLQRVVVKRRLDLSQLSTCAEPLTVSHNNEFGQLKLTTPCSGFAPGQKIPYHLSCQTTRPNCKVVVQLSRFIICHVKTPRDSKKLLKQIINHRQHLALGDIRDHLSLPLDSQISMVPPVDDLALRYDYALTALLVEGTKSVRLSVQLPLIIGSTPCLLQKLDHEGIENRLLAFDNYGSMHGQPMLPCFDLARPLNTMAKVVCESMDLLPLKGEKTTALRRSLRLCIKKIWRIV